MSAGGRKGSRVSPHQTMDTLVVQQEYRQLEHAMQQEHRKKLGMPSPRASNRIEEAQRSYEQRKRNLIEFVRNNFKRNECIRFVPKDDPKRKPEDRVKCHCGELPENHIKFIQSATRLQSSQAIHGHDSLSSLDYSAARSPNEKWDPKKDIRSDIPTNSFGKIDFLHEGLGGRKPSKYLRLKDSTPVDLVLEFMLKHWRMNDPHSANLAITVIGGAKNFKLDGKKKETFNRGLVNAAQTTRAWIITSGCNMGVMKAVGEAVAEGQSYNWDKMSMTHSLRCVGIAPWGYVERRGALENQEGCGSWNASYKVNNIIKHQQPVSLNPNHTHFLLVDDGYRRRYGGVAGLRAQLESKLSRPVNPTDGGESGLGIPVVLVVVEGGYDAILDVSRSIKASIPVVICEGTGRAANILAYAYTHFVTTRKGERVIKPKHRMILEDKMIAAYGKTWSERLKDDHKEAEEAQKFVNIVLECCQDEKLITVFDMNKNEELDLAILSALLKGQGATNLDQLHDQIKLALTWNRSDVAEEKIFNQETNWPTGSLDDVMTEALIDNKVNFVRLLLQNGVVMKEYLTVARLRQLYNSAPKLSHLNKLLTQKSGKSVFTLHDVGRLIKKLMGKHNDPVYETDLGLSDPDGRENFPKPFRELFIWAVLMNRQEMAKFLWERGDEAIPSAIAASCIYDSFAKVVAHYDLDLKESYQQHKEEFERLAVKVLDECHHTDPEKAAMLIERKYSTWGNMNCLQMAAAAQDKEFLSTVCCQDLLNMMWRRGIASHSVMALFCLLLPPLIFTRLRIQTAGGDTDEKLTVWQKLRIFYKAPVTKFAANVVTYLVFLVLYSYMLLFSFRETITPEEWVVIAWMFTLLVEEIREMFYSTSSDTIKERLLSWWNFSIFNQIDLLILMLAITGFALRFTTHYFLYSKMVYSVNCVFLFIRVLRDYSASSYLGPKLVMITRMMGELMLFIAILIVFLLAYGVSSQSLMYPVRDFYVGIFKDIFYYPYWQIYGEIYLQELEGRTDDCIGVNNTIQADGTPCPQFNWLVPVLTAAYLLVGNLLLLNILIAIFNHVFNEIQTNSIQIWKYGMYFLVVEYDTKPILAPPFIIFEHVYLLFRWICQHACCRKTEQVKVKPDTQGAMLHIFEKECLKQHIQRQKLSECTNINRQIDVIHHRVDEMAKLMEEERLLEHQHFEAEQNKQDDNSRPGSRHGDSRLCSTQSSMDGEGGATDKKLPTHRASLDKIKQLKELESIKESGGSSQETSLRDAANLQAGTEAERQHTPDGKPPGEKQDEPENLYDTLDYRKNRTRGNRAAVPEPTYDHIPQVLQVGPARSAGDCGLEIHSDEGGGGKMSKSKRLSRKKKQRNHSGEDARSSDTQREGWKYRAFDNEDSDEDVIRGQAQGGGGGGQRSYQGGPGHTPDGVAAAAAAAEVNRRLGSMEARLEKMEVGMQHSLYNIEALLRGTVFSRATGVPDSRPSSQSQHSYAYRDINNLL